METELTPAERDAMAMLKGATLTGRPIEVTKTCTIGAGGQVNVQAALRLVEKGLATLDLQLTDAGRRRAAFTDVPSYVNPYTFTPPIPEGYRSGD